MLELNPFTGLFDIVYRRDYHSGFDLIPEGCTYTIKENRQSINFTMLTIDGDLNLEGDLWLA